MMLDTVLDTLDPYIAELIMLGISTYFGWFLRIFFRTKEAQENLHKALNTGVDLVTDELAKLVQTGQFSSGMNWKKLESIVVGYTQNSVQDSVKRLKEATPQHLGDMAKAKMNLRLQELREMFVKNGFN